MDDTVGTIGSQPAHRVQQQRNTGHRHLWNGVDVAARRQRNNGQRHPCTGVDVAARRQPHVVTLGWRHSSADLGFAVFNSPCRVDFLTRLCPRFDVIPGPPGAFWRQWRKGRFDAIPGPPGAFWGQWRLRGIRGGTSFSSAHLVRAIWCHHHYRHRSCAMIRTGGVLAFPRYTN